MFNVTVSRCFVSGLQIAFDIKGDATASTVYTIFVEESVAIYVVFGT